MTDTADLPQELIDQVRALNTVQRIALGDLLDEEPPRSERTDAERAAYREMLAARIAEYQRGEVKALTLDEALAAMDEAIRAAGGTPE